MQKEPFFIIGCVRSGTTFLRNTLRAHPSLTSPEETHFFRWSHTFGTPAFLTSMLKNSVLIKHRTMDGISETEFVQILRNSVSRADLQNRYMKLYMAKNPSTATRWFDKTPQNVYGAAMIASQFPNSKFIHIVRNPINVVSSLRIGKVVKIESIVSACNIWNEASEIIHVIKKAYPRRVYEIKYEDLTTNFSLEMEKILNFIDEEYVPNDFKDIVVQSIQHEHDELFTEKEKQTIAKLCHRWAKYYGYELIKKNTLAPAESVC